MENCRKAVILGAVEPGKAFRGINGEYPYRKPTQVGGHKCAKVYERTLVQELGKKAVVTSE